jgi:hypothetical protein
VNSDVDLYADKRTHNLIDDAQIRKNVHTYSPASFKTKYKTNGTLEKERNWKERRNCWYSENPDDQRPPQKD